ncbi:hypothetical protein N9B20_01050 [Mariniblastus sp.]|nr:hypothetical protein [Mariniblastus sp.]
MSLILPPKKTGDAASLFLTSFDPSDLPGSSIDPLGFERGYLFLADKILPGFTNVANYPRYLSMLCAGTHLAEASLSDPPRIQYEKRLRCVLRLERFWAIANVLAERANLDEELPTGGIRGVSYARKQADRIADRKLKKISADFELLSRQQPYGVVGIYASNADGMRLIDRKSFGLTPDLGERLAKDFLTSSQIPKSLQKAIRGDGDVRRSVLTQWGLRCHISNPLFKIEKECIREATLRNPVRARMLSAIQEMAFDEEMEEQACFNKLVKPLGKSESNRDLLETTKTILAYEQCYQVASLAFERMLWLCKNLPAAALSESEVAKEPILNQVCNLLPKVTAEFCSLLDQGATEGFRSGLERLSDVRSFLEEAVLSCDSTNKLTQVIIERHIDIQKGKFDRGRRKMPWVEKTRNKISLTMTRVGGLKTEALKPDDIRPHPYRLRTACSFLEATV